jgi:hypothetical protein
LFFNNLAFIFVRFLFVFNDLTYSCDGQRPRLAVCLASVIAVMAQAVLTGVARDALDVGRLWGG